MHFVHIRSSQDAFIHPHPFQIHEPRLLFKCGSSSAPAPPLLLGAQMTLITRASSPG